MLPLVLTPAARVYRALPEDGSVGFRAILLSIALRIASTCLVSSRSPHVSEPRSDHVSAFGPVGTAAEELEANAWTAAFSEMLRSARAVSSSNLGFTFSNAGLSSVGRSSVTLCTTAAASLGASYSTRTFADASPNSIFAARPLGAMVSTSKNRAKRRSDQKHQEYCRADNAVTKYHVHNPMQSTTAR